MNLGLPVPPVHVIVAGGLTLLTLLVVQMLIGYRKIHFKGKTHLKVHKTVAWVMLAAAVLHGFGGLLFVGIIR